MQEEQYPQSIQQQQPQNIPPQYSPSAPPQYPQNILPQYTQNASPQYSQNAPQRYPQNATSQYPQNIAPQYPQHTPLQYPQNPPSQYPQNIQQQNRQRYQHTFTEAQMRHYFLKPSKIYLWLILWGAAILLLGIIIAGAVGSATTGSSSGSPYGSSYGSETAPTNPSVPISTFIIILGGGLLAGGIIPLFIHYTSRPTDEQYAKWIAERRKPLYKIALRRLHLDESECENIIEVQGGISSLLQLTKKFPEKEIVVKRLPDGRRRYSINLCMYIFFLKDDLAIYSGYINALAQNERFEDADRYYYKDIVAVSTSGPVYTSWDGSSDQETQMQGFLVRVNNGDVVGTDYAIRVILRQGEKKEEIKGVDKVIPALLHLLRDHNVSAVEAHQISNDLL